MTDRPGGAVAAARRALAGTECASAFHELELVYMASVSSAKESGLSSGELGMLRGRLESAREELTARLQREQGVAAQAESLPEPMDAAEQTREQDDAVSFSERDRALLREIEHALTKFDAGTYGVSELSGQ